MHTTVQPSPYIEVNSHTPAIEALINFFLRLFNVLIALSHRTTFAPTYTKSARYVHMHACMHSYALFLRVCCSEEKKQSCNVFSPLPLCYLLRRCRKSCLNRKLNTFCITIAASLSYRISTHNMWCTGGEKKITFLSSCLDISIVRCNGKSPRHRAVVSLRSDVWCWNLTVETSKPQTDSKKKKKNAYQCAVDGWYLTD